MNRKCCMLYAIFFRSSGPHANCCFKRGYIKAHFKLGLSVKSINDEICVVYGDKQMLFFTVYRWFTKFSSSQESVQDAPYSGRPRSAVTISIITKIKSIIEKDTHFSWHKRQTWV